MAPFVEFDLAVMIHSTTESVRLYGTPVLTGGKLLNMLTVRSGLLAVSCRGLAVPGARNTHSRIKVVKQNGNGYRNFERFKQRVLYSLNDNSSIKS